MGKVYQLPRKPTTAAEPIKAVSNCPPSTLYTIVKASSGCFQVVNRSALNGSPVVVVYTAAKKDWAIDWVLLNDDSISQAATNEAINQGIPLRFV